MNHLYPEELKENISDFAGMVVPDDGLAPSGARACAGTVMTKFGSVYMQERLVKG